MTNDEIKKQLEIMEDNIMDHKITIDKFKQYCDFIIRCYHLNIPDIDYNNYFYLLNFASVQEPIDKREWLIMQLYQSTINNLYYEQKKTK